jgi:hypothetical protein
MKKRLMRYKHKSCQIERWVMQKIDANGLQVSFKNENWHTQYGMKSHIRYGKLKCKLLALTKCKPLAIARFAIQPSPIAFRPPVCNSRFHPAMSSHA